MSLDVKITTKTVITERHEIRLTDLDIRLLLLDRGITVPAGASNITVLVPGGGDWSNEELNIDQDCPVIISWTEQSTQES
jgi:hypothetical protein